MYNPFTECIYQIQKNQTVANQPNISNDQTFVLNAIATTVPMLSRSPLAPLNLADSDSLSDTNNIPSQTNTSLNATSNQGQTLHQPHNSPKRGPSAFLPSSSSTVFPVNPFSVSTRNYSVPFLAMNKSVKTFDGLDHQSTPEEVLHQVDAHIIFAMGEELLDPVDYNQWHKRKMA